jgi:hypothetical protein
MSSNAFDQCAEAYNRLQDSIETAKAEREKNLLTSQAFLHELWALAQGGAARDAIAAMRAFIEKNLR